MEPLALFLPISFIGSWIAALYLIARVGGWQKLAEKYADTDAYTGPWKGWQWGRIGSISYKQCLWIAIDFRGLHLKTGPIFLFPFFHKPLLIPWTAIKSVEASNYWWMKTLALKLNEPEVEIMLAPHALMGADQFLGDKLGARF